MTNREFYLATKLYILGDENLNVTEDELITKADELIASLDHKNELRKSADSKEKKETLARRMSVMKFFEENPTLVITRDELAAELGITPGQATSACSLLTKDGYLKKSEVKVDKSKKMAYTLATE